MSKGTSDHKPGVGVLGTYNTKRDAWAHKVSGWLVNLYRKESDWYAGKLVKG
jgi:hypothetical protein